MTIIRKNTSPLKLAQKSAKAKTIKNAPRIISILAAVFIAAVIGVLFLPGAVAAAAPVPLQGGGALTAIEEDGTVAVINHAGYLLSPAVIIRNRSGKSIKLKDLKLPTDVSFQYEYTPQGAVILRLFEVGK